MIIAIDGPAGAGKSTVARCVAQELGLAYINTGAMYRAVALAARERGLHLPADEAQIVELGAELPLRFGEGGTQLFVGEKEVSNAISDPEIGALASKIAAVAPLREKVVARQRELGLQASGGAVLEGRDIQTVVFPEAELKVFLTASNHARARRRFAQWAHKQENYDFEAALRDVEERDARDSQRDVSPLKPAPDALIIDSDELSPEEVVARIVNAARDAAH